MSELLKGSTVGLLKDQVPYGVRRYVKVRRAVTAEAFGSDRFSRPALFGLDRKLSPYLNFQNGVFLEIGANDGFSQSNTYFLEKQMGWQGILVEPVPDLYEHCRKLRSRAKCYNVACASPKADPFVTIARRNLQSVVVRGGIAARDEVRVAVTTLSTVIHDAGLGIPDFISVDVEGFELEVLAGIDCPGHIPNWMLVETDKCRDVAELLQPYMILEAQFTHHDYLFRKVVT